MTDTDELLARSQHKRTWNSGDTVHPTSDGQTILRQFTEFRFSGDDRSHAVFPEEIDALPRRHRRSPAGTGESFGPQRLAVGEIQARRDPRLVHKVDPAAMHQRRAERGGGLRCPPGDGDFSLFVEAQSNTLSGVARADED